jgi:exonuclease III
MKFLSWNCRGLGNPKTVRALKKLINNHQPDLVFIMETKLTESQYQFLNNYRDVYSTHTINCSINGGGRAGGLALIWNHCILNMNNINYDLNYTDMLISTTINNMQSWRATRIYGFPQAQNKHLTCQLINDLSCINKCPGWLSFGDFNLALTNDEKSGGNLLDPNITNSFRNTLNHCDLQDLGYTGSPYTWTNRQDIDHLIQARLDRFLANSEWINRFPNFINNHLVRYKSDHCPILLDFSQFICNRANITTQFSKNFEQIC